MTARDLFISYTGADRRWAEWIAVELVQAGLTTRLQSFDFRPGSDFVHEMDQTVREADTPHFKLRHPA